MNAPATCDHDVTVDDPDDCKWCRAEGTEGNYALAAMRARMELADLIEDPA